MNVSTLAEEIGIPVTQLLDTIRNNGIETVFSSGLYFVTPEVAEQLRAIYRNAAKLKVQLPAKIPVRLRDIDPQEVRDFDEIRRIRWASARGDWP